MPQTPQSTRSGLPSAAEPTARLAPSGRLAAACQAWHRGRLGGGRGSSQGVWRGNQGSLACWAGTDGAGGDASAALGGGGKARRSCGAAALNGGGGSSHQAERLNSGCSGGKASGGRRSAQALLLPGRALALRLRLAGGAALRADARPRRRLAAGRQAGS